MNRKRTATALGLWISIALIAGCQSSQPPAQEEQQAQPAAASSGGGAPALHHRPRSSGGGGPGSAASSQSQPVTVTAPAGTEIPIRLVSEISTGTAQSGSSFEGTLARALVVNGVEVAPVGATVTGQITNAVSSGRLSKPAELSLTLTSIKAPGGETPISTNTWSDQGQSHKKRDAVLIGGGAGVGALVGAIAGHGKGAAIGALVGGGAGTAGAAYTGKKEIVLPSETELRFKLTAPATFTR